MTDQKKSAPPQLCERCGAVMWPTQEPGGAFCPNGVLGEKNCDDGKIHPMASATRRANHQKLWLDQFTPAKPVAKDEFEIEDRPGRWKKCGPAVRQGRDVQDGGGVVYAFPLWEARVFPFRQHAPADPQMLAPWE